MATRTETPTELRGEFCGFDRKRLAVRRVVSHAFRRADCPHLLPGCIDVLPLRFAVLTRLSTIVSLEVGHLTNDAGCPLGCHPSLGFWATQVVPFTAFFHEA